MTVIKKNTQEVMELIKKDLKKGLEGYIGQTSGFKLVIDSEVPKNEIWFVASDGTKHVIKNVYGFEIQQRLEVQDFQFQELTPTFGEDDEEDCEEE